MKSKSPRGFTLIELLVVISIIAILAAIAVPAVTGGIVRGQLIQAVSNARQIHLTAQTMALDGLATNDAEFGWPGDLEKRGSVSNTGSYIQKLLDNDYLKWGDLKIFQAAGMQPVSGNSFDADASCGFDIWLVTEQDGGNTVFATTRNYTYGNDLDDPQAKPFGDKGFVVFRKGGDGTFYKRTQGDSYDIIGNVPGQTQAGQGTEAVLSNGGSATPP